MTGNPKERGRAKALGISLKCESSANRLRIQADPTRTQRSLANSTLQRSPGFPHKGGFPGPISSTSHRSRGRHSSKHPKHREEFSADVHFSGFWNFADESHQAGSDLLWTPYTTMQLHTQQNSKLGLDPIRNRWKKPSAWSKGPSLHPFACTAGPFSSGGPQEEVLLLARYLGESDAPPKARADRTKGKRALLGSRLHGRCCQVGCWGHWRRLILK